MDGGNNGVDREIGRAALSHSLDWSIAKAGRLEETAPTSPVVRDRAPIQTDSGSGYRVSQVAFHGPDGGLAQSHSLSRCTKGRGPYSYSYNALLVYQQKSSRRIYQ